MIFLCNYQTKWMFWNQRIHKKTEISQKYSDEFNCTHKLKIPRFHCWREMKVWQNKSDYSSWLKCGTFTSIKEMRFWKRCTTFCEMPDISILLISTGTSLFNSWNMSLADFNEETSDDRGRNPPHHVFQFMLWEDIAEVRM